MYTLKLFGRTYQISGFVFILAVVCMLTFFAVAIYGNYLLGGWWLLLIMTLATVQINDKGLLPSGVAGVIGHACTITGLSSFVYFTFIA